MKIKDASVVEARVLDEALSLYLKKKASTAEEREAADRMREQIGETHRFDHNKCTARYPTSYELLAQPSAGGLRFFRGTDGQRDLGIYAADLSGATPNATDDGPLRLETQTRPVVIGHERGAGIVITAPVFRLDQGRVAHVLLTPADLLYLSEIGMVDRVAVSPHVEPLARVFARHSFELSGQP